MQLTCLNFNPNNIDKSHNVTLSSLTEADETIHKITKEKKILPRVKNYELKRLIAERDKQKSSKNGKTNTKFKKKLVPALRNQYLLEIGNQIKENKNRINYVEMWSKEKHNDNNIQRQNKRNILISKKHFQTTLQSRPHYLKMPEKIEYVPEYI